MIWIPDEVVSACAADADRYYPNESGGAFLGYENDGVLVVTAAIGGGTNALRRPTAYEPDVIWQNARIAEHYEASGRRDSYLGDWHSHPDTTRAYLSRDDRAVLKKIIKCPDARASRPVMCVLVGTRGGWRMYGWRAELRSGFWFGGSVRLQEAELTIFGV